MKITHVKSKQTNQIHEVTSWKQTLLGGGPTLLTTAMGELALQQDHPPTMLDSTYDDVFVDANGIEYVPVKRS